MIDRSATIWAMRDMKLSVKCKTDRYIVQLNSFGHYMTPETQLIYHGTWPDMDQKKKKKTLIRG